MIISALVNNITLIIALSVLYVFIIRTWKYGTRTYQAISGFLFGTVAVLGMMNPLIISPGLIFDGRSIIISAAGFIGGWVTALIAALMGIIYRTWIGGPGEIMGISVIASSAAIGIAYHYILRHRPYMVSPLYLIGFGIIVHICMLALTLTLPAGTGYEVFSNIAIPVILIYPIGTLLVCVVLLDLELRIKAEDSLKNSETRYHMLFEHSPDGIVIIDPATARLLEFNETAHRQLGYSVEEFAALSIHDLEVDETAEETRSRIAHVIQKRGADFETRQRTKQGEIRDVHVTAQMIEISGKQVYHCVWRDITKRKQAEKALKESEEKYRELVKNAPAGIYEVDYETSRFISVNDVICEYTGYTKDELLTMNLFDLLTEESRQLMIVRLEKLMAGEKLDPTVEYCIRTKDGNQLWCLLNALYTYEAGKLKGSTGVIYNLTDRKQAEEQIYRANAFLDSIIENIPNMIFLKDAGNLRFVRFNRAGEDLLGYSRNDLLGKNDYDFFPKEQADHFTKKDREVLLGKEVVDIPEEPLQTRNKGERTMHTKKVPLLDMKGEPEYLLGISEDITEQKRAEKQLQQTLESLRKAVGTTIQVISSTVEARDPYTSGHQIRSSDLARAIAMEMDLPQDKIDAIRMAGSIHDIGKISIPAEILSKPAKLSDIEFSLIKEHAEKGYEMLKDVESPWPLAEIVYQHHERMDGSGYPRNLKGDDILIEARILTVADVVDAMASHRPYRPGLGIDAALAEIERNRGIFYDKTVADACLRLFREKGFQLAVI